jgi:hypothetical protein
MGIANGSGNENLINCPACNEAMASDAEFCSECGAQRVGTTGNESQIGNNSGTAQKNLLVMVGAGVLSLVVVLGLVFFVLGNKSDSRLSEAVASCGVADASGITFAEDGQSLVFDGKGEDDYFGGDFYDVECMLTALEAPSTVWAQMLQTSSLDGQQEFDFDGINVSWSYHPRSGLDANFVILD